MHNLITLRKKNVFQMMAVKTETQNKIHHAKRRKQGLIVSLLLPLVKRK